MSWWSTVRVSLEKGSRKEDGGSEMRLIVWGFIAQPVWEQVTEIWVDWGCPSCSHYWMWSVRYVSKSWPCAWMPFPPEHSSSPRPAEQTLGHLCLKKPWKPLENGTERSCFQQRAIGIVFLWLHLCQQTYLMKLTLALKSHSGSKWGASIGGVGLACLGSELCDPPVLTEVLLKREIVRLRAVHSTVAIVG